MTIKQLNNLKNLVNNFPEKLIAEEYIYDGCYCTVGYMLKAIGVDDSEIYDLYDYVDYWEDAKYMESTMFTDMLNLLKQNYGLTTYELRKIQNVNDDYDIETDEERAIIVKNYLKKLIKEKESELRGV